MANDCYYNMRIVGKTANVEELIRMMNREKEFKNKGLGRVRSAYIYESNIIKNGIACYDLDGDCAWSVFSSMIDYDIGLISETKRLRLAIEVYSSESGFAFQEHYIIAKGDIICEDVVDWNEFFIDKYLTDEELNSIADKANCTREEVMAIATEQDGRFEIGGFDNFGEFFNPEYLLELICDGGKND